MNSLCPIMEATVGFYHFKLTGAQDKRGLSSVQMHAVLKVWLDAIDLSLLQGGLVCFQL